MNIYKAINHVMKAVPSISKGRENRQQGYNFRGIDDIYNALNEHLAMAGVFVTSEVLAHSREERETSKGTVLIYSILTVKFTFYAEDGSFVQSTMIGEGMDTGDKSSNKAMSTAYKYAFMQLFCIPTEEPKDSENDSHEVKTNQVINQYNKLNNEHSFASDEKKWLNLLDKDGNIKPDKQHLIEGEININKLSDQYKINKTERALLERLITERANTPPAYQRYDNEDLRYRDDLPF